MNPGAVGAQGGQAFVTARLMNAEGQPLLQQDEEEEAVEPIGLPEDLPAPTITTRSSGK